MPQVIEITDEDICYAERILLPKFKIFDPERITFIRNLETIDLQAVPGSGKTTALLAKLLILEKKLPFDDGSGIIVISHTNAAVDEIKNNIQKHCPKLFSYPNFIGTIQSFVDEFLTKPFAANYLGAKINFIDQEKYAEEIISKFNKIKWLPDYGKPQGLFFAKHFKRVIIESINFDNCSLTKKNIEKELTKHSKIKTKPQDLISELNKYSMTAAPLLILENVYSKIDELMVNDLQYIMLDYEKKTICDSNEALIIGSINYKNQVNEKYEGLKRVIESVLKKGIISYRYAYLLGRNYLHFYPKYIDLLRKRFSYVFVDEMQDMDKYQYELLEKIFFDEFRSVSKYQRIGDKNQSIYNGSAKDECFWENRASKNILPLNGSHRLTPAIAKIVNNFALFPTEGFGIVGLRKELLKPCVIKYSHETIQNVIPTFLKKIGKLDSIPENKEFSNRLRELNSNGTSKYPVKVIAWNSIWKTEEEKNNPDNVRLIDYHAPFNREEHKLKEDYTCLKAYLYYFDKGKSTLDAIRKSILNALLKILRLEDKLNSDGRHFTKKQLVGAIKELSDNLQNNSYDIFKLNLYNWSIEIIRGNLDKVYESIVNYIPSFLVFFEKEIMRSHGFITAKLEVITKPEGSADSNNKFKLGDIEVEVTTVHAVKGQTHAATLYLESSYYGEHETERLCDQFLGKPFNDKKVHHKQSTKMAYVGLSRPTDLLCIAVHEDRFDKFLNAINISEWEIENA